MLTSELQKKTIKCVIWDLDNTIWNGILLEDGVVVLKPEVKQVIEELDEKGILQSISSKNNYDQAMNKLEEFGIKDFFLYPQICWSAKSVSVEKIKQFLNISFDSILYIDDQQFELDEVQSVNQSINVMNANNYKELKYLKGSNDIDSKMRRIYYKEEQKRNEDELKFVGPNVEFLKTLNTVLHISIANSKNLVRMKDLIDRTNQLNSTGKTYDLEELQKYLISDDHLLLICELSDRYGTYGKIGVCLLENKEDVWQIKLLLFSCRVISRGVGNIFLTYLIENANKMKKKLYADFVHTGRNRVMYITYKFLGFKEKDDLSNKETLLEWNGNMSPNIPEFITIKAPTVIGGS